MTLSPENIQIAGALCFLLLAISAGGILAIKRAKKRKV